MFETLRSWTLHGSRRRPLIIAIEDLHWIDRSSEEYLASLADGLLGAQVLLLMLVGLESNLLQPETDLSDHHLRRISFADPAVGADHVDDRHVRDAASVGQTSALQIRHLGLAEAAANSYNNRDLPIPGSPTTPTTCP